VQPQSSKKFKSHFTPINQPDAAKSDTRSFHFPATLIGNVKAINNGKHTEA